MMVLSTRKSIFLVLINLFNLKKDLRVQGIIFLFENDEFFTIEHGFINQE